MWWWMRHIRTCARTLRDAFLATDNDRQRYGNRADLSGAEGKLNGHAVRAPVLNASLTDCVFEVARKTTAEEVNALFKAAADGELAGVLGFETRPLVSADFNNDSRSSIVDAASTMVTDETHLKVYAWYDNEVGYACRMVTSPIS